MPFAEQPIEFIQLRAEAAGSLLSAHGVHGSVESESEQSAAQVQHAPADVRFLLRVFDALEGSEIDATSFMYASCVEPTAVASSSNSGSEVVANEKGTLCSRLAVVNRAPLTKPSHSPAI